MWRPIALSLLAILTLAHRASARDHWILLRSANFELYTANGEKDGREALQFFEQMRMAFTDILGIKLPKDKPVTIVAFRDDDDFAPYRPQANIKAYTMALPHRDLILLADLVPEHYHTALHEYTHVIVDQAGITLPVWLNEGFAEIYSTLQPRGSKIVVGSVIPAHLETAQSGLLDLREVLAATRQSPLYHETNRMGVFYAESWALVHMLKFSPQYSPGFERVLDAIGRGEPSDRALESVYAKSLRQIQADLAAYVHAAHFREGVIPARLEKPVANVELKPFDPLDIAVLLDVIKVRGPRRQEGLADLAQLVQANPGKAAPLDALAWQQLESADWQTTLATFRRALKAGTRDANLCFQFAVQLRASIPDDDYLAALRRATEIDPDFSAAQEQLAAHAFNSHDYAEAVARLHRVKKLNRSQAYLYYSALAYASFQTGNRPEARSAAASAQQYANTPQEKQEAASLLQLVSSPNP